MKRLPPVVKAKVPKRRVRARYDGIYLEMSKIDKNGPASRWEFEDGGLAHSASVAVLAYIRRKALKGFKVERRNNVLYVSRES